MIRTILIAVGALPGPPANDLCENAIVVAGPGPHAFDNAHATESTEIQAACCTFGTCSNGQDVWFRWTAPCTGPARFMTCGSAVDTKIAVYTLPCPPGDDSILACNEDACGIQSIAHFQAAAGQEFLLCVGTFVGRPGGAGEFEVLCGPCPCDFQSDGRLDSEDFFSFLNCFFHEFCPGADINADGAKDSRDFFDFLACFFSPPESCP